VPKKEKNHLLICNLLCFFVGYLAGILDLYPRVVIIGALGRCGKGSLDLARKVGIPE